MAKSKANESGKTKTVEKKVEKKDDKATKKGSVKVSKEDAKKIKDSSKSSSKGNKKTKSSDKEDKDKDKEKEYPNQDTEMIKGTFNVNNAKKVLKNFITDTLRFDLGNMGGHFAYSVIAEIIALYVVRASVKYNEKSAKNADLYEVSLENLRRGIRESNNFGSDIKALSEAFDSSAMNYITTFFDDGSEKKLRKFIEKKAFSNTSNIHIGNESINFISYLMTHILSKLTKTVCLLTKYANKSNVTIDGFRYAVNIHFSGDKNELNEMFIQRLDEVEKLVTDWREQEKESKSEKGDDDDDDDGEKSKKSKKTSNKSKKVKKDKDEEEEEEDEEEDSDGDDSDEEDEDED